MSEKNFRRNVDQAVVLIGRGEEVASDVRISRNKRILGLSLIERLVLTAAHSGIRDFLLIGDVADGDEIASSLRKDKRLRNKDVNLDYIPAAGLRNSGLEQKIHDRFWLMNGDAVFSPEILKKAAAIEAGTGKDILVVRRIPQEDIHENREILFPVGDDVRKVADSEAASNRAAFVDAGVGLCRRETYDRLAETIRERGSSNLNAEFMTRLFPPQRTQPIEAGPDYCERMTSRPALKRAERYLLGTARKPTDGFFSKNFNRHISLFLTQLLLKINTAPMPISVVVLFVGLMSGLFVGKGGYVNAVLGALLFELASIIDGCDGENARLTFRGTKAGGTFDITADAVTFVFFFINLPIGLYRTTENKLWMILGGFAFLSMFLFYIQLIRYARKSGLGHNIVAVVKDIERSVGEKGILGKLDWLASKIAPLFRRDFFATMAVVFILPGRADVFMGLLILLSPLETLYMFFYARRRLRPARQMS